MAVIDDRGRLFGLINLIDAGVGLLAIAIVAMIAVGFSVFRVPGAAELTSVEPASQPTSGSLRLFVRGKNFLPFMRVSIQRTGDSAQAVQRANLNPKAPVDRYALVTSTTARFFVESPSAGEVWLPETVEPGTYDLVLYNESKQVGLKEAAFTITPAPPPPTPPPPPLVPPPPPTPVLPLATVRMYGAFTRLNRVDSAGIAVGSQFTSTVRGELATVLSSGTAEPDIVAPPVPAILDGSLRVPAILRVRCSFAGAECRIGTTPLARNASISLTARNREYTFTISEFVTDSSPLATVRASGSFVRLDRSDLGVFNVGARLASAVSGESGEVLGIGRAGPDIARIGEGPGLIRPMVEGKLQLPAVLRIRCSFTGADCRVWTTPLAPNASIELTIGGHQYAFVIAELAPDLSQTTRDARVVVRLVTRAELAGLIKQGDTDTRVVAGVDQLGAAAARIASVGPHRESTSTSYFPVGDGTLQQTFVVPEPVVVTDVTVSVPVTDSSAGWSYKGQVIRVGGPLAFDTARYTVRGYIISVAVEGDTSPPKR